MNKIFILRPRQPQIWHGFFFFTLRDRGEMNKDQAAQELRLLAKAIGLQFVDLELDLDEESLNVN